MPDTPASSLDFLSVANFSKSNLKQLNYSLPQSLSHGVFFAPVV